MVGMTRRSALPILGYPTYTGKPAADRAPLAGAKHPGARGEKCSDSTGSESRFVRRMGCVTLNRTMRNG